MQHFYYLERHNEWCFCDGPCCASRAPAQVDNRQCTPRVRVASGRGCEGIRAVTWRCTNMHSGGGRAGGRAVPSGASSARICRWSRRCRRWWACPTDIDPAESHLAHAVTVEHRRRQGRPLRFVHLAPAPSSSFLHSRFQVWQKENNRGWFLGGLKKA